MIREEIGEDSYWLACIAPYAPCLGLADGMRVSNDAGPSWSEGSQGNMIQETLASQYFNNVFWQNDPDCVVLRDERTHLAAHEVEALALWSGILGGTVTCSDLLHRLPPERLALWRFLEPGEKATAALPFWEKDQRLKVAVRRYAEPPAWGVFFLNPAGEVVTGRFDVGSLWWGRPRPSSGSGGRAAPRPWGSAATSWSRRKGTGERSTTSASPTRRRPRT